MPHAPSPGTRPAPVRGSAPRSPPPEPPRPQARTPSCFPPSPSRVNSSSWWATYPNRGSPIARGRTGTHTTDTRSPDLTSTTLTFGPPPLESPEEQLTGDPRSPTPGGDRARACGSTGPWRLVDHEEVTRCTCSRHAEDC